MAAPRHVPTQPTTSSYYSSPPQRTGVRPRAAEVTGAQPTGAMLGSQGPDQGFIYKLLPVFDERLSLFEGEDRDDVDAGVIAVALKRASQFGRAPVIHDLTVAYTLWGFLDASPSETLVRMRRSMFEEVASAHHRAELRQIPDAISAETLAQTPTTVQSRYDRDWNDQLDLEHLAH